MKQADGVKSAEGAVSSMNVTVVNADNKNMGSETGAPTIAGNWTDNDLRSMEITSGHAPARPHRGDGRRRHREEAPPEAG